MIKAITSGGCSNTERKRLLGIRDCYVCYISTVISLSSEYNSFILLLSLPFHYYSDFILNSCWFNFLPILALKNLLQNCSIRKLKSFVFTFNSRTKTSSAQLPPELCAFALLNTAKKVFAPEWL